MGGIDPAILAGLLYCGAGMGAGLLRRLTRALIASAGAEAPLARRDWRWLGVTAADIPQLSINAFNDPCSATNPRQASVEEIESIYERALMHSTADARPPAPGKPAPEKLRAYMEEGLQSEHVARSLREKITGLGERSIRKSYYPQLRQQLERLQVMAEELNHRVKNTLATVMALSTQTFHSAELPEAFREAFEGRLLALSQTHNLLNRSSWAGVSLRDILRQELGPYDSMEGGRFLLDGNDLKLGPVMAVTLGMAFHELATNAAKYGALSAAGGKIRVVWRISSPGSFTSNGKRSTVRRSHHPAGGVSGPT